MPASLSLPTRPLLYAGLLYLAFPFFLFLGGWLQPVFSIPLGIAMAWALHATGRNLPDRRLPLTRRGLAILAIISACCLLLVLLCGFTGHFQQHADFLIRNAVYQQLIREPWPLVLPDGHHFIYYLGHWLPPSLAASFCPPAAAPWLLAAWTFLGLELAFLAAACRWGMRTAAWWAFILFCVGSPAAALDCAGLPLSSLFPEYNAQIVQFIGMPSQLFNTFNHAVPALLCSILVLTRSLPASGCYLTGAMLLPGSPLAAVALFPYILYDTLLRRGAPEQNLPGNLRHLLCHPVFWTASLLVAIMGIFYAHLDGGSQFTCLFAGQYAAAFHYTQQQMQLYPDSVKYASFLLSLLLGVLLPGILLLPACKRMPLYYVTLGMLAFCLFFRTGIMNNELLFKAPAVLYPFLAFLFLHAFRHGGMRLRALLAVYLAITALPALTCIGGKMETFSTGDAPRRQNRQEGWQGTLDHPEEPFYRQFIKKDGHPLPAWLFR